MTQIPSLTAHRPTATQLAQHEAWKAARARMHGSATLAMKRLTPPQCAAEAVQVTVAVPVNLLSPPNIGVILKLLALRYGVHVGDIVGNSRKRSLSQIRHEAVFLAWTHTGRSFPNLGARVFGKRDHTTMIHSVSKHLAARPDRRWLEETRRAEEGAETRQINATTFPLFEMKRSQAQVVAATGLEPWQVEGAINRFYLRRSYERRRAAQR